MAIKKAKIEKYVAEPRFKKFENNFDNSMRSIAKSFADQHNVMELMLKEIRLIHEDNKQFRMSIAGLNSDGISYERRIENLTFRVEKLEGKIK